MEVGAVTWPPPWRCEGPSAPAFPPPGWPSKGQLDYTKALIVVGLLLLALPYVAMKLVSAPERILGGLGRAAIEGGHS